MNYDEWIAQPFLQTADYTPVDWSPLEARIPGLKVEEAGGWVPYQVEGTLLGLPFYFRSRSENSRLNVYSTDANRVLLYSSEMAPLTSSHHGFAEHMLTLVPELKKARFMYKFARKDAWQDKEKNIIIVGKETVTSCEGFTPEDALERFKQRIFEFSDIYLEPIEGDRELTAWELWDAFQVDPEPLNEDDRVFPDMLPDFRVLS